MVALTANPTNAQDNTETHWRNFGKYFRRTGVVPGATNEFQPFADGSGMQVKVNTGEAFVKSHWIENDAIQTLTILAADATNPRIDRVIIKVAWGNPTAVTLEVKTGTPDPAPSPPTLDTTTSVWEFSLAQVYVGAGVTSIAADKVTDERVFSGYQTVLPFVIGSGGEVPSVGVVGHTYLPENVKIKVIGWRLSSYDGTVGSMVLDLWHDVDRASADNVDAIPGAGNEPALSTEAEAAGIDLSGWATTVMEGGCLVVNLDSVATITQATLVLDVVLYPVTE